MIDAGSCGAHPELPLGQEVTALWGRGPSRVVRGVGEDLGAPVDGVGSA
jgi:hypothetical protein